MAAVSALEPAPRTCGGDGSAPSLDAGEPAALPPAAGRTATGTALGSRVVLGAGGRAARPGSGGGGRVPSASCPRLSPPCPHPASRSAPRGGRSCAALQLFAGVGCGSSTRRELPKRQFGARQGKGKWGVQEQKGALGTALGRRVRAGSCASHAPRPEPLASGPGSRTLAAPSQLACSLQTQTAPGVCGCDLCVGLGQPGKGPGWQTSRRSRLEKLAVDYGTTGRRDTVGVGKGVSDKHLSVNAKHYAH